MTTTELRERFATALENDQTRRGVEALYQISKTSRARALDALPAAEDVRDTGRAIRLDVLRNLDSYLLQLEASVQARGGHVHWAPDAGHATATILDIAARNNVELVCKSKSMVTEEIGLNTAFEDTGIEVVETDLGEYILQLRKEHPSHIIAPAIHLMRQQVAELFNEHLGLPITDNIETMMGAAREALRQIFLTADMGVSGVNFAVAETGTIAIVTNEGNAGLTTTAPRVHVAVMGMERLVRSMHDLDIMLRLLGRSATGQKLSVYTDLITGPRRDGDPDGPEEFHLVIVDNGRSRVLASELAESLLCIRCGACLNVCPVYREIGGHAYGFPYSGPIGAVITPALNGPAKHGEIAQASSLCGACQDVCPVRIDLPTMLVRIRGQHQANKPAREHELAVDLAMAGWKQAMTSPALYRMARPAGRLGMGILNRGPALTNAVPLLSGWAAHRTLPEFPGETFRDRWQRRLQGDA